MWSLKDVNNVEYVGQSRPSNLKDVHKQREVRWTSTTSNLKDVDSVKFERYQQREV